MPNARVSRFIRISPLALAAAVILPVIAVAAMNASGQDVTVEPAGQAPEQEYRVYEPNELIFVSAERAVEFLNQIGSDGWILPDGAHIIVHTFEPGTANQLTRFLIRHGGPYDEESAHLIARRERP